MPRESKLSPRRIEAIEKQKQALELRMAGRTWQEIANVLGYKDHSGAVRAVEAALSHTLEAPSAHYRALTLERLTKVLQVFWPTMLQGSPDAARTVLHTIADNRKLMGLDAPVQLEHGGNGTPIRHEVISVEIGDVTNALRVLADVGAIRMESNGHQPDLALGGIHPAPADS